MLRICRVERRGDEHEVNSHFCAWCQTLASYPPAISPLAMRALRPCLVAAFDSHFEQFVIIAERYQDGAEAPHD